MPTRPLITLLVLLSCSASAVLAKVPDDTTTVSDLSLSGLIDGRNITFTLSCDVETRQNDQRMALLAGDVVLDRIESPKGGYRIQYDPADKSYRIEWPRRGTRRLAVVFVVRPRVFKDTNWHEATFQVPASRYRRLQVVCARTDIQVQFPNAMRVERSVVDGRLVMTAVQGPGQDFQVRWKPHVQKLDAELVMSSEVNTIVTAGPAALRVDSLFEFDVSQGSVQNVTFDMPAGLRVTHVRGAHVRDWSVADEGDKAVLTVTLTEPQSEHYRIQVQAQIAIAGLPAEISVPAICPADGVRTGGQLAAGTNSAIALVVEDTSGLSQIDVSAFQRAVIDEQHPRPLPNGKGFYYNFAGGSYRMHLALKDMVPVFDAAVRGVLRVLDDNLSIDLQVELDVRDAPLRDVVLHMPPGYLAAEVSGEAVGDHSLDESAHGDAPSDLQIRFKQPVLGRTLLALRLELGHSPLHKTLKIGGLAVRGAQTQRGYVLIVPADGIDLDEPDQQGLRQVHTGSVPLRVANAAYAYRFRDTGWSLELSARPRPADVRVELFHLITLADGVAYGGIAVNYFISGAPLDELHFQVPTSLANVEFVGRDVVRAVAEGDDRLHYRVKLNRKVVGDYNLGITYTQPQRDGQAVLAGAITCDRVRSQVGFITIASHLNVQVKAQPVPGAALLQIGREEVPANYRLLVNAPILETYKYVNTPHGLSLGVQHFERGSLLPVVIEVVDLNTRIAMPPSGPPEAVTNVRYMVKNATEQFLALSVPRGASVWTTAVIDNPGDPSAKPAAMTASLDEASGRLLIPLRRGRDPNQPIAIELAYGQVLDPIGWHGHIDVEAPRTVATSTFDQWTLRVPAGFSVLPSDPGSMVPEPRVAAQGDLGRVMNGLVGAWRQSLATCLDHVTVPYGAIVAIVMVVLIAAFARRAVPAVAAVVLVVGLLLVGIHTANSRPFAEGLGSRADLTKVVFTQHVNEQASLHVVARIVPAWRQHATVWGALVIPGVALLCLAGAGLVRRGRVVLLPLCLAGLCCGAAQFHESTLVLAHLFTWGLPLVLGAWCLWRVAGRRVLSGAAGPQPVAAACLALGAFLAASGGATSAADSQAPGPFLDHVELDLTAGRDNVQVELKATATVDRRARFELLGAAAVLISEINQDKALHLVTGERGYALQVTRKGTHRVHLTFLVPLAGADAGRDRQMRIAVPPALTNRVRLHLDQRGLDVRSPNAMHLSTLESGGGTIAAAMFAPGDEAIFNWRPRSRQRQRERTVFYAQTRSVAVFDAGLVVTHHLLNLQIAQGELSRLRAQMPPNATVTSVEGQHLGAWRYNPAARDLEVKLAKPVAGDYHLFVTTQTTVESLPYEAVLHPLQIHEAAQQGGHIGLLPRASVNLALDSHPPAMNVADFSRDAAALLKFAGAAAVQSTVGVRHAFHLRGPQDVVRATVWPVRPQLRATEQSGFTVSDDRLVYNGDLTIEVAKAAIFSVRLRFDKGYDVDALTHPLVSHWDERIDGEQRVVEVHLREPLMGSVALQVALSRPVSELPADIAVPRVQLEGALKHTGRIVISSQRGVGLSVTKRRGVSELDPLALGIRGQRAAAYKLLSQDWELALATELIEPRITVDFLHVANVSDGMVRHTHTLRHLLENAGSKQFDLQVPAGASGLLISGADIARREQIGPGLHRIELADKWYDRPYVLSVKYETRYDVERGLVELLPVKAVNAELQRGNVVVRAADRMRITPQTVSDDLSPQGARGVPVRHGAGDLSDAVLSYRSNSADYALTLAARRPEAAALLSAEVQEAELESVMTEDGQSLTRATLRLSVGSKRHLQVRLPTGGVMWSLLVNGRPTLPSLSKDKSGKVLHLVPLAQVSSGQLPVQVDFVYITPMPAGWTTAAQQYQGPRFDLPLRNVRWVLYVPEGYGYDDFTGTLSINEERARQGPGVAYDLESYEATVQRQKVHNQAQALAMLKEGNDRARRGDQRAARAAMESAWHFSLSDPALNEDARVQLSRLVQQQAMVGLIGSRARLRRQTGAGEGRPALIDEHFRQDDAERLTNGLGKADSENLQRITDRMMQVQKAASTAAPQLIVNLPRRGRVLEFSRPILVNTDAELAVSFTARPQVADAVWHSVYWLCGIAATLVALFVVAPRPGWRVDRSMASTSTDS